MRQSLQSRLEMAPLVPRVIHIKNSGGFRWKIPRQPFACVLVSSTYSYAHACSALTFYRPKCRVALENLVTAWESEEIFVLGENLNLSTRWWRIESFPLSSAPHPICERHPHLPQEASISCSNNREGKLSLHPDPASIGGVIPPRGVLPWTPKFYP